MNYSKLLFAAKEKYCKGSYYMSEIGKQRILGEIKWNKELTAIRCSSGFGNIYNLITDTWAEYLE